MRYSFKLFYYLFKVIQRNKAYSNISMAEIRKRKVRAPQRYREDGTYYSGPKDPKTYYNNYYHTKGAEEQECFFCKRMIRKSYMYKHCQTKACVKQMEKFMEMLAQVVVDGISLPGEDPVVEP